jgi:hypothetical protein
MLALAFHDRNRQVPTRSSALIAGLLSEIRHDSTSITEQ